MSVPRHTQIPPSCTERRAALEQLDRDGGADADRLDTLAFQVCQASSSSSFPVGEGSTEVSSCSVFGVAPFFTPCGPRRALGSESGELDFSVRAPTTSKNLYRVLRALQARGVTWRDLDTFV